MGEIFEALNASKYDPWFLLGYWLAAMLVLWPAIIRVVRWWQRGR